MCLYWKNSEVIIYFCDILKLFLKDKFKSGTILRTRARNNWVAHDWKDDLKPTEFHNPSQNVFVYLELTRLVFCNSFCCLLEKDTKLSGILCKWFISILKKKRIIYIWKEIGVFAFFLHFFFYIFTSNSKTVFAIKSQVVRKTRMATKNFKERINSHNVANNGDWAYWRRASLMHTCPYLLSSNSRYCDAFFSNWSWHTYSALCLTSSIQMDSRTVSPMFRHRCVFSVEQVRPLAL